MFPLKKLLICHGCSKIYDSRKISFTGLFYRYILRSYVFILRKKPNKIRLIHMCQRSTSFFRVLIFHIHFALWYANKLFFNKTIIILCITNKNFKKQVDKIFQKITFLTLDTDTYVCVSGGKKYQFFGIFCARTKWYICSVIGNGNSRNNVLNFQTKQSQGDLRRNGTVQTVSALLRTSRKVKSYLNFQYQ